MSAFRDLLREAHVKGVRTITFTVDLDAFARDDQAESWIAIRRGDAAGGRTGEEALRRLVDRIPGPGPE